MNKQELVDAVALTAEVPKATVEKVFEHMAEVIKDTLHQHTEVTLPGLGKLKVAHSKARTGRNPSNGAPIDIPAKKRATFTAAKALKDALN